MGFGDIFNRKPKEDANAVLVLTPLGKEKAEKTDLPTNTFRVMNQIRESGPSSAGDISRETGIPLSKVHAIANHLQAQGYLRKAAQAEE